MVLVKEKTNSAKHAFFFLTSFLALAFTAFAVGNLCFQIINFYFPEDFDTYSNIFRQSAVKFSVASLVVAAPVYYFLSRIINRSLSKKDLDEDSGIRRWLTYLVMFVTVAAVMGDLIAIIFEFLDGELTARFLLKSLTILIIAGGIFLYYFTDMKNESQESRQKKNTRWSFFYLFAIIIPLFWSFAVMENPKEARLRRIDQETEQNLQNIQHAVESYFRNEKEIPVNLSVMKQPQYNIQNKESVQYTALSDREYELCGDFKRDNTEDQEKSYYGTNWSHPDGQHCFTLRVPVPTSVR